MKKIFLKNIILIISVIALSIYLYVITFPRGFQYADPQPNFLVTLIERTGSKSLRIVLEADTLVSCIEKYNLRASSERIDTRAWIKIDGLYVRKEGSLRACRPRGLKHPSISLDIGSIEDAAKMDILFTFGYRMNKYSLVRKGEQLLVDPKDGGFTTIVAYEKYENDLGMPKVEKYSEKYNKNYYQQERFEGKDYTTY